MTALETAIQNIAEYEFSVDRDDALRLTLSEAGRIRPRPGVSDEELLAYGARCVDYLRFGYDLEVLMDGLSPDEVTGAIKVRRDTPACYRALGLHNLPMLTARRHLLENMHDPDPNGVEHWHGMTAELVRSLPELLERPALISDNPNHRDSFLVTLNAVVCLGEPGKAFPVVVPIKPNGQGFLEMQQTISNFIKTVFGADDAYKYFGTALAPEDVVLIDSAALASLTEKAPGADFSRFDGLARDRPLKGLSCLGTPDAYQRRAEELVQLKLDTAEQAGRPLADDDPIEPPYDVA